MLKLCVGPILKLKKSARTDGRTDGTHTFQNDPPLLKEIQNTTLMFYNVLLTY